MIHPSSLSPIKIALKMSEKIEKNYRVIESSITHRGVVFDLQIDKIEYDSGNRAIREVALHNGGAVVLPVKDDGKIIFITQFRYPFQKYLLELPAGKLDKNEDPFECASRELAEETGYTSTNIEKMGEICTTPGFCTEILYIYLAKDLNPGNHNREEGEFGMEIFEFTLEEVEEKIRTGEIIDGKTISAIHYYKSFWLND